MRDQFTFYRSFWEAIKGLKKKDDRLAALEAICAYALDGEERRNTDVSGSIFTLVKPVLDAAERKSSGGKNKGSKAEATDKIPSSKAEDAANKKEGEIEVEGEIEKEIEKEKELYIQSDNSLYVSPSLPEIEEFARERNSPVNLKRFFTHYEGTNWTDNKGNPIRDWKKQFMAWENYEKKKSVPKDRKFPDFDDDKADEQIDRLLRKMNGEANH